MNFSKIATFFFAFFMAAILVTIVVLVSILVSNKPPEFKPIENTRFGNIEIFGNSNKDGPLIIYVSESGNVKNSILLNGVISKGGLVAHVNLDTYLKNSKDENMNEATPCYEYAGEFTRLTQVLQKELKMTSIDKAVLISHGNKASTLSFLMQEYLSAELFVSFSIFDDENIDPSAICSDPVITKFTKDKLSVSKALSLKPKDLFNNWVYLNKKNSTQSTKLPTEVNPLYLDCKPDSCPLFDKFVPKNKKLVSNLPIVENIPDAITSDYYVIFLSGDGGWATIDKEITKNLIKEGIPVVGINTLKYLWKKKSPDRIANDVGGLINTYNNKFQKNKVVLLGFSLGANMIPFINSRLSKDNNQVVFSALLSPTKKTEFEVHFTDWLPGGSSDDGISVLDELKKSPKTQALCLAGEDDGDSMCLEQMPDFVDSKKLKGSHHFDEDYATVSSILLEEFRKSAH